MWPVPARVCQFTICGWKKKRTWCISSAEKPRLALFEGSKQKVEGLEEGPRTIWLVKLTPHLGVLGSLWPSCAQGLLPSWRKCHALFTREMVKVSSFECKAYRSFWKTVHCRIGFTILRTFFELEVRPFSLKRLFSWWDVAYYPSSKEKKMDATKNIIWLQTSSLTIIIFYSWRKVIEIDGTLPISFAALDHLTFVTSFVQ